MKKYISKMTGVFVIPMCMFGEGYKETLHENMH